MTNSMNFPRQRFASNAQAAGTYYAMERRLSAHRRGGAIDDKASKAYGTILFPANPGSGDTITLGGTVVTFDTDVTIGVDLAHTLANLMTFLAASEDANILKCTYQNDDPALFVQSKEANDATFTLAASAATVSGSALKLMKIFQRVNL